MSEFSDGFPHGRVLGPIESAALAQLQELDEALQRSPLAFSALHLARVQDTTASARDVATIAREFRATWQQLTEFVQAEERGGDDVDDLLERRQRRHGNADAAGAVLA